MTGTAFARWSAVARVGVWRLLGAGAICVALLGLVARAAHAELNLSTTFGAQGTGDGQFAAPRGIGADQTVLDPSSGDLYVADTGNARVEQFSATGTFLSAWGWGVADGNASLEVCTSNCRAGIAGNGVGQLSAPTSVAVDSASGPSQGDVYVGDSANRVVDEFSPSGSLLGTITGPSAGNGFQAVTGVAVDGEGNLWILDGSADVVYEFSGGGALLTQFNDGYGSTGAIAVNSAGDVYLIRGSGQTERWNAAARAGGAPLVTDNNALGVGLGVDQATNDLYVDLGTSIDQWGPSGASLGNFGLGGLGRGEQLAYNPNVTLAGAGGPGVLYAVDEAENRVAMFVPPAPAPPTIVAGSETATGVTPTAATLKASINANGLDTTYYFEYGSTTAYGTQVPLPPGTDIGSEYGLISASAALSGLAVSSIYHFRVVAVNSLGTIEGPDQTFTTGTPRAPTVESEQALNITATGATLRASVNPQFVDTHYYFEYGSTAAYGTHVPVPPGSDIGESNTSQNAEAAISGLSAGSTYHFRVVAVNALGTTYGSDTTLTTAPPLTIAAESAANVAATVADLTASISTENLATTYYFEYGTTPAYGLQVPLPEATLAAATSAQKVTAHLENLQPDTTYYFRVVATNALGTAAGSGAKFTTNPPRETFSLPDGRVYEQVSPPYKNGDVGGEGVFRPPLSALGESSASGEAVTYVSSTAFGDARSAELATRYLSRRGPLGWTTHAITPPAVPKEQLELRLEPFHFFTPELTAWIFAWKNQPLTRNAPPEIENLYLGEAGGDAYQLLDDGTPANPGASYEMQLVGASSDLHRVVFEANEALTPGAPAGVESVYEWTPDAPLRLVSVLPGPGEIAAASASGAGGQGSWLPNRVSADGSRVFWADGSSQLYVREDGTSTVQLNASQRTPTLGNGTARFVAATPDGSRVFFIDETPLTNAAGDNGGLYEYSFVSGQLTDLTPDAAGSPGVKGVSGIGEDGASVYFLASASLTSEAGPGGAQPTPGANNLYLTRNGTIVFIASLSSEDRDDWTSTSEALTARVTPDGAHLAFISTAPLTGYDNTDLNTGGADDEVFLYDAGAETLRCASCNPTGERPIGPASVPAMREDGYLPRYLSENGQRVFFDSEDALLPAASNGKQNVYEYEDGAIHLISSGAGDTAAVLADASANGDNVFFNTRARLVAGDQDENYDMYDARVDGGFPTSFSPAPCSGEGCRGPVSVPPAALTIVSEETHGAEAPPAQPASDPVSAPPASGHKAKKSKHKSSARHAASKAKARKAKKSHKNRGGRRAARKRRKGAR